MPFIPHTPESLLRRSDSKNPVTTCKGITTSGVHCRRSLASHQHFHPFHHHRKTSQDGVLAVLEPGEGDDEEGAAAYFCWQHKDQAANLVNNQALPKRVGSVIHLKKRSSVDTLAERLGLLDIEEEGESRPQKKRQWEREKAARKEKLPKQWQTVDGPVLSLPTRRSQNATTSPMNNEKYRSREPSGLALLCCVSVEKDRLPPPRAARIAEKSGSPSATTASVPIRTRTPSRPRSLSNRNSPNPSYNPQTPNRSIFNNPSTPTSSNRPKPHREGLSPTQTLLSIIPKTLSPETTSALLAELAKPVSPHDEPGYIYIFWLTPSDETRPDTRTTLSLLSDSNNSDPRARSSPRRKSNAPPPPSTDNKTILLKIGRASNVQRRMNEWTRQCGYNLSLIRFYPYIPSSSSSPSSSTSPFLHSAPATPPAAAIITSSTSSPVKKVPHVHRVERLVHLELAAKRVKRACESCGREHREWFEVQGTKMGVGAVDAVVRRWVAWGERAGDN